MISLLVLLGLVVFLLSNRVDAEIDLWPFGALGAPPLGATVLAALILGFLAGLLFHLPPRLAAGRRAKKAEKRAAELETKLALPATK